MSEKDNPIWMPIATARSREGFLIEEMMMSSNCVSVRFAYWWRMRKSIARMTSKTAVDPTTMMGMIICYPNVSMAPPGEVCAANTVCHGCWLLSMVPGARVFF